MGSLEVGARKLSGEQGGGIPTDSVPPGTEQEDGVGFAIRKEYHVRFRRKLIGTVILLSTAGVGIVLVVGMILGSSAGMITLYRPWLLFAIIMNFPPEPDYEPALHFNDIPQEQRDNFQMLIELS